MSRRKRWVIAVGAVLAALALAGFLFVRSARFQVWSTLRRVREYESLTDPERWLRERRFVTRLGHREAGERLAELGGPAVAPLTRALDDEDYNVREAASLALCDMAATATPALVVALTDDAVPALSRVLDRRNEALLPRFYAAMALGRIGPMAKDAVPALVRALDDPVIPELVHPAAWALGQIGAAAKDAIPALEKMAQGDEYRGAPRDAERVRKAATEALKKIQPEQDEP